MAEIEFTEGVRLLMKPTCYWRNPATNETFRREDGAFTVTQEQAKRLLEVHPVYGPMCEIADAKAMDRWHRVRVRGEALKAKHGITGDLPRHAELVLEAEESQR